MSTAETLKTLECFRNSQHPFLYIVEDKILSRDIFKMFPEYCLETGFGSMLTRHYLINNELPWIATEPDDQAFDSFQNHLAIAYKDARIDDFITPLIAVKTFTTQEAQRSARVLVYRNLDYRRMEMIHKSDLSRGQRVVLIVNDYHVNEMQEYFWLLDEKGYNPKDLKLRSKSKDPLTLPFDDTPNEYMFDFTK